MKNIFDPKNISIDSDHGFVIYRKEDDGYKPEELSSYEIIFDYRGIRYYCYIDALSIEEAIGIFFCNYQNLTWENIADTIEI